MGDPRTKAPAPTDVANLGRIDRAIRAAGVIDRNRFARLDRRMMPDRLALPAPIALLLGVGR